MTEVQDFPKKITNAVASYFIFLKSFNNIRPNYNFIQENNLDGTTNKSYILRSFHLNCYLIDKEFLDNFKSAINFNELKKILDPINEENKNKFKEKLKKYLDENPYNFSTDDVKIFSTTNEIQDLLQNNEEYEIVNEKFCLGIGISPDKLDKKKLLCTKCKDGIYFFSQSQQFLMSISPANKIIYNINKNIYYVDELSSKILVLLYAQNKHIDQKLKKQIKNVYGFEQFYLVKKEWIKTYQEFFQFEIIKNKLKTLNYPYKGYKFNLQNIVKNNIGQILLGDSKIPNDLKDGQNLLVNIEKIYSANNNNKNRLSFMQETIEPEENNKCTYFECPIEFEIINEDIYQLLKQQNFFNNDDIEEIINDKIVRRHILFGENIIILKNLEQNLEKEGIKIKKLNEYLIYSKTENDYRLWCIINYYTEDTFLQDIDKYIKGKGLSGYISNKNLDIDKIKIEQIIEDEKQNVIGKFFNVSIVDEDLKKIDRKSEIINRGSQIEICNKTRINYISNTKDNLLNSDIFKKNKKKLMDYQINSTEKFEYIKNINNLNNAINKNNINDINITTANEVQENSFIKIKNIGNNYSFVENEHKPIEKKGYLNVDQEFNKINEIGDTKEVSNIKPNNILSNNISDNSKKIDEIKKKFKSIQIALSGLSSIFNTKSRNDVKINNLTANEIKRLKSEESLTEIFLLNNEEAAKLKKYLNLDLYYQYKQIKDKNDKLKLLNENINKFSNLDFLQNSQEQINFIKNFNDCKLNIKSENKFWIINEAIYKIYDKNYTPDPENKQKILFFLYKSENYIFINDGMEILKVLKNPTNLKDNFDNFVSLELIKSNKIENVMNDLIKIREEIERNHTNKTVESNLIKKNDKFYNQYYIFNKEWFNEYIQIYKLDKYSKKIDGKTNEKTKESIFNEIKENINKKLTTEIKPKLRKENLFIENLEYPIDFEYIQKDENNEKIIEEIADNDIRIKLSDFLIYEIFIDVFRPNELEKNNKKQSSTNIKYICIIIENKQLIYIYSYKNTYNIEKIIKVFQKNENDTDSFNELVKLFKENGIDACLAEMGIDFEKINISQNLIDINIEIIGQIIIYKKEKNIKKKINQKSACLEATEIECPFFNSLIQCLINIKPMMDTFMDRQNLIKMFKKPGIKISKEFSVLLQNLWFSKNFLPYNFLIAISELKNNIKEDGKDIYSSVREFVCFLLETMHNELNTKSNINDCKSVQKYYTSINELKNDYYSKNNSQIQKNFFFGTETVVTCNCQDKKECIYYSINKCLYSSVKHFISDKTIKVQALIEACLNKKTSTVCSCCNTNKNNISKFINFPEVLLITTDYTELNFPVSFTFNKDVIDLKKYSSQANKDNKTKYKLRSVLTRTKKNKYKSNCLSPNNNKWYHYNNNSEEAGSINNFDWTDSIPTLLVYEKINN